MKTAKPIQKFSAFLPGFVIPKLPHTRTYAYILRERVRERDTSFKRAVSSSCHCQQK